MHTTYRIRDFDPWAVASLEPLLDQDEGHGTPSPGEAPRQLELEGGRIQGEFCGVPALQAVVGGFWSREEVETATVHVTRKA